MRKKVSLIFDKDDIKIKLTSDKIINITGMIGSGKSTLADNYRNNKKYIVISLDCFYRGQDKENNNFETMKIIEKLKKKYPNKDSEQYFKEYYYEILEHIKTSKKDVIWVLEGQHIYRFLNISDIKGELIIKRTCLYKCWIRSITREIKRKKTELNNKLITKKDYYNDISYWIKRRTNQLKYYKDINKFLLELED